MTADLFVQILVVLSIVLVPAVGWLIHSVIKLKADVQSSEVELKGFKEMNNQACVACRSEMGRRIDGNKSEADRRFEELKQLLNHMNDKLDKLIMDKE